MGKEVSESCVDSLLTEMVSSYSNDFYANKPELAARRLESIGYQVGHQLSERYTMDRPRFSDHLEAIKFICKDFWSALFKKQIDNLKTNHRPGATKMMVEMKVRREEREAAAGNGDEVRTAKDGFRLRRLQSMIGGEEGKKKKVIQNCR